MIGNVAYQTEAQALVAQNNQTFVTSLSLILKSHAFSNRMLIAPRRLALIAREEYDSFCRFLEATDVHLATEHGKQLAQEGLGQSAVLGMVSALRRTCTSLKATDSNEGADLLELAEDYTTALLDGYMQTRETDLLREQERTRNAFNRTQA
jgi:hypothetical protein